MKVAITGAGGFVGKELTRFFSVHRQVMPLTRHSLDITDVDAVRRTITDFHPDLIINCAVSGVNDCESNPSLAHAVNVAGPKYLAEAAAEIDAEFLHFSTNYVFDGKREVGTFYTCRDAALPINKYGETKLAGELAARMASPKLYILRTSWVFGAGKEDNFFGHAPHALMDRKRLRAVTDVHASVTYVDDLVARVDEILARHRYDTYHVVNDGACSYYEYAMEVARELKLSSEEIDDLIEAVTESEMHRDVVRPRYTAMRCVVSEELGLPALPYWKTALSRYLNGFRI